MLPSRYWLLHVAGVTFRADSGTAERIREWMESLIGIPDQFNKSYEFEDIYGSTCVIYAGALNSMYDSTLELRDIQRMHELDVQREQEVFDKANANFA